MMHKAPDSPAGHTPDQQTGDATTSAQADTPVANTFVPEWSKGPTLGFIVDQPVTSYGYDTNFLPRVREILDQYGEVRLIVYFKAYKGWESEAAAKDMAATALIGKYFTKIAFINAPESFIALFKVKQTVLPGDFRYFTDDELQQAIDWAQE